MPNMGLKGFYEQAVLRDFSRDFQMRVISIGPGILNESDNVYITTANLPGYAITNQPTAFMGLDFNIPGSAKFPGSEGWEVTMRCDSMLAIRDKIIAWQKSIFDAFPVDPSSVGNYGPKSVESVAKLAVFNRDGKVVNGMELIGIYPVNIGAIGYNTTGTGAPLEVPITFAYQWWKAAKPELTLS